MLAMLDIKSGWIFSLAKLAAYICLDMLDDCCLRWLDLLALLAVYYCCTCCLAMLNMLAAYDGHAERLAMLDGLLCRIPMISVLPGLLCCPAGYAAYAVSMDELC
jgi:hypothetical protein